MKHCFAVCVIGIMLCLIGVLTFLAYPRGQEIDTKKVSICDLLGRPITDVTVQRMMSSLRLQKYPKSAYVFLPQTQLNQDLVLNNIPISNYGAKYSNDLALYVSDIVPIVLRTRTIFGQDASSHREVVDVISFGEYNITGSKIEFDSYLKEKIDSELLNCGVFIPYQILIVNTADEASGLLFGPYRASQSRKVIQDGEFMTAIADGQPVRFPVAILFGKRNMLSIELKLELSRGQ